MGKRILSLLLLLSSISVNAQLKPLPIAPHPPTEEQEDSDRINHECKYLNRYTPEQRDSFYPFNIAKEIKLVSFDVKPPKNGTIYLEGHLPMKGKKLIYSDLIEIKTLDKSQIDTLTDILYNNFYKGFFSAIMEACFDAKNAVIFLDQKGALIAYIEISFECETYLKSSKKIAAGDFCNQKYYLLKAFFRQVGIEFGITKGLDE